MHRTGKAAIAWIVAVAICGATASRLSAQESTAETVSALIAKDAGQLQQIEDQARQDLALATARFELALAAEGTSKHWIGIGIEEASESVRSQLGLADRGALIVTMVAENSPGKEVGLQVHDVLTHIKAGDEEKDLKELGDLTGVVTKAEKTPLELTVIRQGKSQRVTVTPMERPQPQPQQLLFTNVDVAPPAGAGHPERVAELLKELQALVGQQPTPTTIHFAGPVLAQPLPPSGLPPGPHQVVTPKQEFPQNATITITKSGNNLARVEYKLGEGRSWGATEKELETLPPEGRQAVVVVTNGLLQQVGPQAVVRPLPHPHLNIIRMKTDAAGHFTYHLADPEHGPYDIRKTVTTAAPQSVPATKSAPTADRLSQVEKQLELLQKQQQEVIHLLKKTMEKTEQK
ncbi:MAG TPA: PDZ domain-containing protein [Planctomycetaceae bacterium]|nr:PDZ domain-containing protein [Planctomycetaceae bacterium]